MVVELELTFPFRFLDAHEHIKATIGEHLDFHVRQAMGTYAAGFDAALLSAEQATLAVREAAAIENMAATVKALAAARSTTTAAWKGAGERSAAHHLPAPRARRCYLNSFQKTQPTLRCLPDLVHGIPVARETLRLAVVIPIARFQLKPPLFIASPFRRRTRHAHGNPTRGGVGTVRGQAE